MIRKITVQFFNGAVDIISYAKIYEETTKTAINVHIIKIEKVTQLLTIRYNNSHFNCISKSKKRQLKNSNVQFNKNEASLTLLY